MWTMLLNPRVLLMIGIGLFLAYTHYKAYDLGQDGVEAKYLKAQAKFEESERKRAALEARAARSELQKFTSELEKDRVDAKQELSKVGTPCPADAATAELLNGIPSTPPGS